MEFLSRKGGNPLACTGDGESEIGRRCTRRIGKHRQESGPEHRATSQH
jgi:hypothetical protein